ncbi:hypothetical protein CQ14_02840 [Bradyrhizobium lablabi]|uniref:DUF6894 domain-containing protein n=1 Tax=Bradyrhizobium lablabi TaxID=722472 RepID=A0A0R3N303_9BRAD|nr:hypothetical protein [Bradyrhizobium lablabi]KRR26446.1 hypothetical protein CQ14_02840 [Bradyrhizobium lablabi]
MALYYFDLRDGDVLAVDEEGMELRDMQAVQEEAARSMADAARDAVLSQSAGSFAHMSVEVRDDDGPVMRVRFSFDIDRRNA